MSEQQPPAPIRKDTIYIQRRNERDTSQQPPIRQGTRDEAVEARTTMEKNLTFQHVSHTRNSSNQSSSDLLHLISPRMQDDTHPYSEDRVLNRKASRIFKYKNNAGQGSRRKLRQSQKRKQAGITLDTGHSRHHGMTPKELRYGTTAEKHAGLRIFASPGTALNSPVLGSEGWWRSKSKKRMSRSARGTRQRANSNASDRGIIPGLDALNAQGASDHLSPSKLQALDISPADRPIFIGMSVPTETLSEVESDIEARTRTRSDSGDSPFTPTIIITPAVQRSQFSPEQRPRLDSSVYSRLTSAARTPYIVSNTHPPVPALPDYVKHQTQSAKNVVATTPKTANVGTEKSDKWPQRTRDSNVTDFEEDEDTNANVRRNRVMSGETVFEEDDGPVVVRRDLTVRNSGMTIDTNVPTPRRSRGWWNYITTPFDASHTESLWPRTPAVDTAIETPRVPEPKATIPALGLQTKMDSQREAPLISAFSASTVTTMASPWGRGDSEKTPVSPIGLSLSPSHTTHAGPGLSIAEQLSIAQSPPKSVAASVMNTTPPEEHHPSPPTESSPPKNFVDRSTVWPTVHPEHHSTAYTNSIASHSTQYKPIVASAIATDVVLNTKEMKISCDPASPPIVGTLVPDTRHSKHGSKDYEFMKSQSLDKPLTSPYHPPASYGPRETMFPGSKTESPYARNGQYSNHTSYQSDPRSMRGDAPQVYTEKDFLPPPRAMKGKRADKPKRKCNIFRKKEKDNKPGDKKKRKKRMCIVCGICWGLLLAIVLTVVLVLVLTKKHKVDDTPVQSQWLNLTNFPPIPTGISTIAAPNLANEETGCVSPATQWSCSLPKEEQDSVAPNKPDQPNFRLVIRYNNDTGTKTRRQDDLFSPSPSPPSTEDQTFLGNTTDKNVEPFAGENTPFFISFITPSGTPTVSKRQANDNSTPLPNITDLIPPPATVSGGLAAPANLLPLPVAQPLHLYNRGTPDEHYGFYTYFDRAIFLKDITGSDSSFGGNPADQDGGASFDSATLRCTWAQTRFLVQIWTNSGSSKPLLSGTPTSTSSALTPSSTLSANDFTIPGSFPYPVTITLDRHGGTLTEKMIYCYGMDTSGKIDPTFKKFTLEDRAFGGVAVNGAKGPSGNITVSTEDGGPGGIDGGSGGCGCSWVNWAGADKS